MELGWEKGGGCFDSPSALQPHNRLQWSEEENQKEKQKKGKGEGKGRRRGRSYLYSKCLRVSFLDKVLSKSTGAKFNTFPYKEKEQILIYKVLLSKTALFLSFSTTHLHFSITWDSECEHGVCTCVCVWVWTGKDIVITKKYECSLSENALILERTKEGIWGLNSNGTKGTTAGRRRECTILTRVLHMLPEAEVYSGGSSEAATSDFLLKE